MMFHEMTPEQKVAVNPKVVPLPILKAVLNYTWRAFGHNGYFISDDDMEYMVEEMGTHNPATAKDLMRIADEFKLDSEHQEALFGAFVYLGFEVFGKDRRLVEYLKRPAFNIREAFDQHPYKGVIGHLEKDSSQKNEKVDINDSLDAIKIPSNRLSQKSAGKRQTKSESIGLRKLFLSLMISMLWPTSSTVLNLLSSLEGRLCDDYRHSPRYRSAGGK